jgi:hypothetical protein
MSAAVEEIKLGVGMESNLGGRRFCDLRKPCMDYQAPSHYLHRKDGEQSESRH